eukprot:7386370-Prymnesium_polylepis.1
MVVWVCSSISRGRSACLSANVFAASSRAIATGEIGGGRAALLAPLSPRSKMGGQQTAVLSWVRCAHAYSHTHQARSSYLWPCWAGSERVRKMVINGWANHSGMLLSASAKAAPSLAVRWPTASLW